MRVNRGELLMFSALKFLVLVIGLAIGLVIASPLYWNTVNLVLMQNYPITYAYIAQGAMSGAIVLGIVANWAWNKSARHYPELMLLMVLAMTLFLGAMSDIFLRPLFPAFF